MAVRKFNPITPGMRHKVLSKFDSITTDKPHKPLLEPLRKNGGRNNDGKMTMRYRGGGHKRMYRVIDFKRNKHGVAAEVMTIEYARNALGLTGANSTEFDIRTPHPVIDLMESQRDVTDMGGTMRLGAYVAQLKPGSRVAEAYGEEVVSERHRHRYEFNPRYRTRFEESDLVLSGESPDGRLVEFIELENHPFWIATQAHPEFKSRPDRPAPLFREFVGAALDRAAGRNPQLPSMDDDLSTAES